METIYDWVTVGIFAGLIVLFLQRSTGPVRDEMWPYLAASVFCAGLNQVGNKALEDESLLLHALTVAGLAGTLYFIHHFLRPFGGTDD